MKETTETIKYNLKIEDKEFLSSLSKIDTSIKGTNTTMSSFQNNFNKFSTNKFQLEMEKSITVCDKTNEKVKDTISLADKLSLAMDGASAITEGLKGIPEAMKSIESEGLNLSNSMELASSSISAVSGCAAIGTAICPGFGTAIGGLVGAGAALFSMFKNTTSEAEKHQEALSKVAEESIKAAVASQQYSQSLIDEYDSITKNLAKESLMSESHKSLIDELKNMTDENGNVKAGYEDRAQFIVTTLNNAYGTEIKLINGVIENYQKEIKSVEDVIAKKQQEMVLKASEKQYLLALEKRVETSKNLANAEAIYNKELDRQKGIEAEIEDMYNQGKSKKGESLEDFQQRMIAENKGYQDTIANVEKYKEALEIAQAAYDANAEARINYQALQTAIAMNDAEAIAYYTDKVSNTYYDGTNMLKLNYEETLEETNRFHDKIYEETENSNTKVAESLRKGADNTLQTTKETLLNQSQSIMSLTPNVIETWGKLAEGSTDKFLEYFKEVPEGIRQHVIDKMQDQGYEISSELQAGIEQIDPTIKVRTDTTEANTNLTITADTNQASSAINSLINQLINKPFEIIANRKEKGGDYANGSWQSIPQYANGGLPNHGTMFIAGERGAEIVGHINGRTEVLNRSQIASAIYSAVATAMSNYGSNSGDIRVYAEEGLIVEKVSNGINKHVKQTGRLPFTIPL